MSDNLYRKFGTFIRSKYVSQRQSLKKSYRLLRKTNFQDNVANMPKLRQRGARRPTQNENRAEQLFTHIEKQFYIAV